jgi:hypothetical protein
VVTVALAAIVAAWTAGPSPVASAAAPCAGDIDAGTVAQHPGPRLRFGITPGVQAGQIGPRPAPAVPEQVPRTLSALGRLRPAGGPFVLRLNRFFWSDGEAGLRRFLALADRYTRRGYLVELQVRYHPNAAQEGDIGAWERHVREVVRRFGPNPRVVALQITNEVNFTTSADSSDGSYSGARDALVRGVIAAKDEARRRGLRGLAIGFNWAYRLDPATEQSFWQSLRDKGGAAFARAVDWIGLDAYPGTVFPPAESPGGERDGMVNAMSTMRCFAAVAGISARVPMKVEENGWPTFGTRPESKQADVLRTMVRAVHDFRGTYNVSDYRWFNLRDGDTSSAMPFQHFGLLRDDYSPKAAFAAYRSLVSQLSIRSSAGSRRPRLAVRVRSRVGRARVRGHLRHCRYGRLRATVSGRDRRRARRATFYRGRHRAARDTHPPLSRVFDRRRHRGRSHRHRVRVRVRLADGRLARLSRAYRVCGGHRLHASSRGTG